MIANDTKGEQQEEEQEEGQEMKYHSNDSEEKKLNVKEVGTEDGMV